MKKILRQKSEMKKEELKNKKMKELQEKEGKLTSTETSEEGNVSKNIWNQKTSLIDFRYKNMRKYNQPHIICSCLYIHELP